MGRDLSTRMLFYAFLLRELLRALVRDALQEPVLEALRTTARDPLRER